MTSAEDGLGVLCAPLLRQAFGKPFTSSPGAEQRALLASAVVLRQSTMASPTREDACLTMPDVSNTFPAQEMRLVTFLSRVSVMRALAAAAGGAIVGIIVSLIVNIALVELSVSPFFSVVSVSSKCCRFSHFCYCYMSSTLRYFQSSWVVSFCGECLPLRRLTLTRRTRNSSLLFLTWYRAYLCLSFARLVYRDICVYDASGDFLWIFMFFCHKKLVCSFAFVRQNSSVLSSGHIRRFRVNVYPG